MQTINWGIIGCGNVTEVKSGPAFNRVPGSCLKAVMRRDAAKAEDYARRHHVPHWYTDAAVMLNEAGIDAVYIATPPDTHAYYAVMAARAGKHVYVEKPMALHYNQCLDMIAAAKDNGVSLFAAYYRRALPYFLKVKELLDAGAIGAPRVVHLHLFKPGPDRKLPEHELPWRFKPQIAGGGLFVDVGSHQLDILDFLFGPITSVHGQAVNQAGRYPAEDAVTASFAFESGVIGAGAWCFTSAPEHSADHVEIIASGGRLSFSTFSFDPIHLETPGGEETFTYERPLHIQEHMVKIVTEQLLGIGHCPCGGEVGARTTRVMENILSGYYAK